MIKLAQNDNEIADGFHVIKQLRTELVEAAFVGINEQRLPTRLLN
ncbi:MAG TPA: hypothetical protein VIE65_05535 [Methylobacter sp.]|jgi:hypothetical protein